MIIQFARSLWKRLTETPEPPAPAAIPVAVVAPSQPARPGRPVSTTLLKAVEAVAAHPNITAPELASLLSISPSYGRTLLRRARARQTTPAIQQRLQEPNPSVTLTDLNERLTAAEKALAVVRSMPAHARTSLNLNRRAEVLRLLNRGLSSESVAEQLGIAPGEVDFIRKVDRMLAPSA